MKKLFSVPLFVGCTRQDFDTFKDFLKKHNDFIYDIYYTHTLPPFNEDGVGGIGQSSEFEKSIYTDLDEVLSIQRDLDIKVSLTFNNIFISPSEKNLNLFIKNFAPLYEKGVRSITLPFTNWVFSGKIDKAYPGLFKKNTVLWKVHSPREIWNLAEAGFDYINLDRSLLRNRDLLLEVGEARDEYYKQRGKYIYLSILANESPCQGHCPFREEHSALLARHELTINNFPSPKNICLYKELTGNSWLNPLIFFKLAFVPPFKEDSDALLEVVDVFKMFGRIVYSYFQGTLKIIEEYASGKVFYSQVRDILDTLDKNGQPDKLVSAWRKEIKTCNFKCYKCDLCDRLYKALDTESKKSLLGLIVFPE